MFSQLTAQQGFASPSQSLLKVVGAIWELWYPTRNTTDGVQQGRSYCLSWVTLIGAELEKEFVIPSFLQLPHCAPWLELKRNWTGSFWNATTRTPFLEGFHRELQQQPLGIDFKYTKPVTKSSSLAHSLPLLLCVLPPFSLDPYVGLDTPDPPQRGILGRWEPWCWPKIIIHLTSCQPEIAGIFCSFWLTLFCPWIWSKQAGTLSSKGWRGHSPSQHSPYSDAHH